MKRTYKKLLAFLLAALMALSLLPATAFAQGVSSLQSNAAPAPNGYIHVDIPGSRAVSNAYKNGDMDTYYRLSGKEPTRDTLPSSWDSRNQNWITSVKNQNPYGSCWAHAAMGSVEAYMIKHGIPVGTGSAATTSLNLSESQHCYYNYNSAYDAEGMTTGDKCTLTGSDNCLNSGGNGEMSAYTLQHWTGAADESAANLLTYSKASTAIGSSGFGSNYAYQYNVCHVQNSEWIPASNIEAVKEAIMKYGAGNISYYETGSAYTYSCTIDTSSQESSSHKWANHAITLIGWDDSIAASNFKPNKPSGSGAWLCKNSWGTSYFNGGYCWISYEDTSVLEGSIFFYDAESIDNYDHNYQYDGTCNPVCYGQGWDTTTNYYLGFENNTQVANVFTAKGSESLKAVAFCSWDEAMTYTIQVYKNPTTGNPSSGTLCATETGTLTFPGYYTIPLSTPVALGAGDTFSVVVTQNVPEADENGKYVHTPYDATFSNTSVVSWANWTHANHGDTSYYKEPNGSWTDCPENGDYRIKAFTNDVTFTLTAVSNNTAWGTVSVDGSTIIATPANGYYVESCDVISGTASCTINGNRISVSATADCTVRVNFAPKPSYTVNFVASGEAQGSQTALIYDVITLPSTVSVTADGWTFAGWMDHQIDETTDVPAFYAPGESYTVTANVTLYAVYTRVEGSGTVSYEQVTAALTDWTGRYVLTGGADSNRMVLKSVATDGRIENNTAQCSIAFANTGITENGTKLSNVDAAYVFDVVKNGSYYTIQGSTGYWIGTQSTYLHNMASYQSEYSDWNIDYDTYNACMKISNVASTQYTYLVRGSNTSYFVVNTSYTGQKTQLYKEVDDNVTYYWTDPVVAEHTHELQHFAAVAPTCGAEGSIEYWRCTVCGKYFSDAAGENEITLADTVLPATGNHTWGAWTSNNNGTHTHTCTVCGATEDANCSYEDVVTPPTAGEQGYTTHTCTVCGYSFQDTLVPALGYDYTVHFTVPAGVTAPADMVSNTNTGITLPTADAPEGYTFLGWVTEDYDNVETRPAEILTGNYTATQEITLKALYTYTEGSDEITYELVTAAPADWAGNYVITNNYTNTSGMYVFRNMTGSADGTEIENANNSVAYASSGITLTDTTLTNVASDYVVTLAASGSYYTVQNASGGTYYGMNSSSYMSAYTAYNSTYCNWTPGINNNGIVQLKNAANGSYPYFSWSTSNNYFWSGSSSNANVLKLWKETLVGTAYYTTIIGETHEHEWGAPTYEWAADNSTCKATMACTGCEETVTETVNAVVTTTAATCEEAGLKTYTATFTNAAFQPQTKTEAIPATGHTPGEPVIENNVDPTCEAAGSYDEVVYCTVCGKELSRNTVTVPATGHTPGETVIENNVDPTCETAGSYDEVVYCTVCGKELSRNTVTVPATGHDWGTPGYVWAADNSTCTATRICANDTSHTETETANATYAVITEPTTEAEGLGRYTAVFQNAAFETQTKDVVIPKIVVEGYHITVDDKTAGNATTSINAEALYSGEVTFTVACEQPCLVAIDNGNDAYTVLTCTTEGNTHSFTVTVTADVTIVIAVKGDANLDGTRDAKDATFAAQAMAGKRTLSVLQQLMMDGNGDGEFDSKDATFAAQVEAGKKSYQW